MKEQLINLISENNSKENGLSINVPIEQYVNKLVTHSTLIPYYTNGNLKGMISYYNNDETQEHSFLTLLLISKDYQGKGLGKLLLQMSINDLIKKGFKNYSLEVLKSNDKAIKLYEAFGFEKNEDRGELWLMEKKLM